jgi:hypothetical protein
MLRISRLVVAASAVSLLAACAGNNSEEEEESTIRSDVSSGSCGVERWSIKTGTDSAESQVNMTPQNTTIGTLDAIPAPTSLGSSSPRYTYAGSPEIQVYRLTNVTLTQYKLESDSDYHLIVTDGSNTMIAEIPDPACVTSGAWASAVSSSRAAFDARYAVTTSFQTANVPVTITGAGFFDILHGQTGVAPNGIELHSVLSICFGTNCAGGATPDFSLGASPASVSGSGSSTISVTPSGGFSGTVNLSASGAPAGATATLNPTAVSSSGSSTLTLSPGSAAAGTYAITVTGTSGSLSHATSVSWTIAGSGGGGALTNGDFESGLTGWTSTGTTSASTAAHTGAGAAMVGSTSPTTDSSLSQTFTLPSNASALSFYYKVVCPDTVTYDWASATLKDNTSGTTTTMLANTCSNSGSWVQASASVTGGHSVTLTLSNHDDNYSGDPTYTLYDTVANATSGGGDTTPPTTSVTAPASGATVSGTVTVTATASDNVGVTKIELYVDGALLGSGTTSPASASWNTTTAANGTHSITSKAYDAAGNVGTSAAVSVTVSNSTTVVNPFANPGFETGTLASWTASGTTAARPYPHTGSYSAALGSSSPTTDSSISQTVTMPSAANTLSFWYKITCPDSVTYDWATATLKDNVTGTTVTVLGHTCTNTNSWVQASTSVTAMRGHSVTLTFANHDDNYAGDPTYTDYDDVNVQ